MMKKWLCVGLVLLVGACESGRHNKVVLPPPSANTVEALAAAVKQAAALSDRAPDEKTRVSLSMQANVDADRCLKLEPDSAACHYSSAIALGLQAKAYPARGGVQILSDILAALNSAESADPKYDHAGPARVAALVYLRAPGWPLGPGDADTGLQAAKRAVALEPDYPPNRLALGEAFVKTGDYRGARDNYVKARELAQAMPASPDRDDWVRQATEALQGR
jgi:tetratricopeptide (TPR) repeat protein